MCNPSICLGIFEDSAGWYHWDTFDDHPCKQEGTVDKAALAYFKAIGEIQTGIANATTLEEALHLGLKVIVESCHAYTAIIWYMDYSGDGMLHPYYWIGENDITSIAYAPGDGIVGRVFETEKTERLLDLGQDAHQEVQADFENIEVTTMICVPFSNNYEKLGCIQLINRSDGGLFTDEDADVAEIMALMAALAIDDNDRVHEPWKPGKVLVSLRNVVKEFQNAGIVTRALKKVNLDIYEGEFLVLLGESGCGKTTLLNIIGGMDQVSDGTFTFCETDYSHATQSVLTEYRRSNIGFIFQSYNLMPNLNAYQNLQLIAELVDDPMDSMRALELVGLDGRERNYPSQLSGGQQQRVSIARALVKRPKIILADEPTAALDYTTSIEILAFLKTVITEGATLMMVTHNEEIARMANRVVRIRDGRVYEVTVNRHPAEASDLVW